MPLLKVGPHASTNPTGLSTWMTDGQPTVAVYQGSFPADVAPGCLIVGRPVNTDYLSPSMGDPVQLATRWYNDRVYPVAMANRHIKTWIASNEPDWKDREWSAAVKAEALAWYGAFDYQIAKLANAHGLRMVLGNAAVGCWEVEYLKHWQGGMRACREFGAYYGGHYYGPLDKWHSYKFVEDLKAFRLAGYSDIQIIGTEGGAEGVGGMQPWRKQYGDVGRYISEWVRPFELEARKHPNFVGLALFTLGDPGGWSDYDVAGHEFTQAMVRLARELGPVTTVPAPKVGGSAPVVTAPTTPSAKAKTHTVVKGDTLYGIAARYGLTLSALLVLNPQISNASLIHVGQVVRLASDAPAQTQPSAPVVVTPAPVTPPPTGGKAKTYTVKAGDTLTRIALRLSTSLGELLKLNPEIVNANIIHVGQVIRTAVDAVVPAQPAPAEAPVIWDVSRYQERWYAGTVTERINFDTLAAYTGEYAPLGVYARATVNAGQDWSFARTWSELRRIKRPRGPYMAVSWGQAPAAQLSAFYRALGDDVGEWRPMIDVEDRALEAHPYHTAGSANQYARTIDAVVNDIVKRWGKTPIIYSAIWFWVPSFLRFGITTNWGCPAWMASYPLVRRAARVEDVRAGKYKPDVPLAWQTWDIWQFSDSAVVPGITANTVDVNIVRPGFVGSLWV